MAKVIFIIGANATGKSYYINENYSLDEYRILDIDDYREKAYEDAGYQERIPFGEQRLILLMAQNRLIEDIIMYLKQKKNVVVEHTLFRAKRRINYIDQIRISVDAEIIIYVMQPSRDSWLKYIKMRNVAQSVLEQQKEIEFPNFAEGFDAIYEVTDGQVRTRKDDLTDDRIIDVYREEIAREDKEYQEKVKKKKERKQLMESMKTKPFWHICEVCGKKEHITSEEAYKKGWDYPPKMGYFGLLGPRTCGNCKMTDTLFWKVQQQPLPIVFEGELTDKEAEVWERIKKEPLSLLENSCLFDEEG